MQSTGIRSLRDQQISWKGGAVMVPSTRCFKQLGRSPTPQLPTTRGCHRAYPATIQILCHLERQHKTTLNRPSASRRMVIASSSAPADVVCIGEALFDLIADQKGLPRDKVESWTAHAGGAPCNVATCLARLGVSSAFITALGRDDRGKQLVALLESRGVLTTGVQLRDDPTRDVYVVRDENGDREFAGFGMPNECYSDCFIEPELLPVDTIKTAKVLVTGTLGLAYPTTRAAMQTAVAEAKEGGALVMVDVNWRPVFWQDKDEARKVISEYLAAADIIKLSDADLVWLYGLGVEVLQEPCAVAERLPSAVGVLVTAGEYGAAYCFRAAKGSNISDFIPVYDVAVADTTGAGDAFTAGFLQQMLAAGGLETLLKDPEALRKAVVFASACGALTCMRAGAIESQPTLEECQALAAQG